MIGYAVGETVEYTNTTAEDVEREEESGGAVVQRQQSSHLSCYEVVTAWVHPRYSNPGPVSTCMYLSPLSLSLSLPPSLPPSLSLSLSLSHSYRGLNFSMHMYYDIACQGKNVITSNSCTLCDLIVPNVLFNLHQ